MGKYLIFDWGGTAVKYACSDENGNLTGHGSFPTPESGLEALLDQMRSVYEAASAAAPLAGIAISSPGAVDGKEGVVRGISAISYIHEIPIVKMIRERLDGLPVSIENDANCVALGEMWLGAAKGKRNFASVVCGTGIGGAVVINGALYKGSTNNGGEFGNFLVKQEEGEFRTWSQYTIVKQARKYKQATGRAVNGKELLRLAQENDETAVKLTNDFYEAMAVGCYNLQFTLDTELIVLGGGISESESLVTEIYKRMDILEKADRFAFLRPKLITGHFGSRANLYGALYCHLNK